MSVVVEGRVLYNLIGWRGATGAMDLGLDRL
jgi:hypothetical protein